MLALDYGLKPVLSALKAQEVLQGVFAQDLQITHYDRQPEFASDLTSRIDDALENFWLALQRRHLPLIHARFDSPALNAFKADIASATGVIISTPVYKASFAGALKTVLDLLPERALEEKVVLPLASGGSVAIKTISSQLNIIDNFLL
ncbi:hypothetical protein CRX72_13645 [Pantoea sp. BRM17]|nr:hypothetical protein CRX72_13645 [Pantoea sp. BRM17]